MVEGRRIAEKVLAPFPNNPIPEIKRFGRTWKQWREAFSAYFDTRRVARGFRNPEHYLLRMLLIGGRLSHHNLRQEEPDNFIHPGLTWCYGRLPSAHRPATRQAPGSAQAKTAQ